MTARKAEQNGLLAQLVRVLGCQLRDHGFESRIDRERLFFENITYLTKDRQNMYSRIMQVE